MENYTSEGLENIQYQGIFALRTIEAQLESLYAAYGYHPVMTPTFEPYDLFVTEPAIPTADLFKLVDRHGQVLALKPDATLAICRMAAVSHPNPQEILKFSCSGNTFRNFAAADSTKKELTQMGVEYFGNENPECDGEVIALAIRSLLCVGITDVHIDLGHVGYIGALVGELALSAKDQDLLFGYIENKNIGDIEDFLAARELTGPAARVLPQIPTLYGEPRTVFSAMEELCINEKMRAVVAHLQAVYTHLETIGLAGYITFDLGFTNQMSYYSDIIFKGYVDDWGEAVLFGGRYDQVSRRFGVDRPACGFSADLIGLLEYREQHGLLADPRPPKTIIFYANGDKAAAYTLADELRDGGKVVEVFRLRDKAAVMVAELQANPLYVNSIYKHYADGRLNDISREVK